MSDNQTYLGAQDASSDATHTNVTDFMIDQKLAQISTAKIVKIVKGPYDKDGKSIAPGTVGPIGYVDVQPMVNQVDGRGDATAHGTVHRLSYHRNQGGLGAIINDPVVGDIGIMTVSDRDTSSVRATDKVANPGSRRKFDMADGTFVGTSQARMPEQYVTFKPDGMEMHDKHNNKVVTDSSGIVIEDKNGNKYTMNSDGVRIDDKHGNKIVMSSAGIDLNP